MVSTRKNIRKGKRNNRTMNGGAAWGNYGLIPLAPGQLIRRVEDRMAISFVQDLARFINRGPIADVENKLKALEARISALEQPVVPPVPVATPGAGAAVANDPQ
jgi:hypothetical protein